MLSPSTTRALALAVTLWSESHLRDFPWRRDDVSPYEVLVAEVLLKRTTATAASRAYRPFLASFPSVASLAKAELGSIAAAMKPVGLYNQRAKSMKELATSVMQEHSGVIPKGLEELLRLPGVGEYTARAVRLAAFKEREALVDSNVLRVMRRLTKSRLTVGQCQRLADGLVPVESAREYNWALLDLGSEVCRYDYPRCGQCPLTSWCGYARSSDGRDEEATE
jgi:A/G-specific adenine glycosylase